MDDIIVYDDIEIDDIRYEIDKINVFSKKIKPYNAKSNIALHKFWIHIEKCKIIEEHETNDIKSIVIALPINSNCISIIKNIEKVINDKLIEDKITKFSLISKLIDSDIGIPKFEIIFDENTIIFNENDKELKNSLDLDDEISVVCELDFLLLSNNNLKTNWKTIQIKKIQSINLSSSLFLKLGYPKNKIISKENNKPIQDISLKNNIIQNAIEKRHEQNEQLNNQNEKHVVIKQHEIKKPPQIKKSFSIPTKDDLMNALCSLKKIKLIEENKKNDEDNKIMENEQKEQMEKKLKHVETKEFDFYKLLKDEHEQKNKIISDEQISDEQLKSLFYLGYLRKKIRKYHKRIECLLNL
jgi:hypothetical protein